MRIPLLILVISALPISLTYAASQGDNYVGLQYSQVTYDEDDFDDAEPTALVGKIGQFINESAAIEGRLGYGISDDEIDVGPFDVEIEINYLVGVYGVFHTDTDAKATFYGLVGVTKGELEASAFGESFEEDDTGLSYGLGVNIGFFNLEYMSYLDEDDYSVTAISAGFVTEF